MVGGYDFAEVIAAYWRGYDTGEERLKNDAVRWLRGEFSTRTDARAALGVRTIVDDANLYDQIKLMSRFVCMAGYTGLLVCLDEMVNLYKLANTQARNGNYEQVLRILNDTLQGSVAHLGFVFSGSQISCSTPAAACSATQPCSPASPRIRMQRTALSTTLGRCCAWLTSAGRTSICC
jgi:hypothetical protein